MKIKNILLILLLTGVLFFISSLALSVFATNIFEQRLDESLINSRQYMEANRIQPELISSISFAIKATAPRVFSTSNLFSIWWAALFSGLTSVLLLVFIHKHISQLKSQIEELKKELDSKKLNA